MHDLHVLKSFCVCIVISQPALTQRVKKIETVIANPRVYLFPWFISVQIIWKVLAPFLCDFVLRVNPRLFMMTHCSGILAFHRCNKNKKPPYILNHERLTISLINLSADCIRRGNCLHLHECWSQALHYTDNITVFNVIGTFVWGKTLAQTSITLT